MGGRLAATHMSMSRAHKPTPQSLRIVENYVGLALRRVMHDHRREEQRRAEKDRGHQQRAKRVFSALTRMNAMPSWNKACALRLGTPTLTLLFGDIGFRFAPAFGAHRRQCKLH